MANVALFPVGTCHVVSWGIMGPGKHSCTGSWGCLGSALQELRPILPAVWSRRLAADQVPPLLPWLWECKSSLSDSKHGWRALSCLHMFARFMPHLLFPYRRYSLLKVRALTCSAVCYPSLSQNLNHTVQTSSPPLQNQKQPRPSI